MRPLLQHPLIAQNLKALEVDFQVLQQHSPYQDIRVTLGQWNAEPPPTNLRLRLTSSHHGICVALLHAQARQCGNARRPEAAQGT